MEQVTEWRELRITLGEGGAPAQRELVGVTYIARGDGTRTPDEPVKLVVTADEARAYLETTSFALTDALDAAHARIASDKTAADQAAAVAAAEIARLTSVIEAKDQLIAKYTALESAWNEQIAPAIDAYRTQIEPL